MRKDKSEIDQISKQIMNLQHWGDKSGRSTDSEVGEVIINLKKTIENQESKLKKLELFLAEHRQRMKQLQRQYEKEKQYSQSLKAQLSQHAEKEQQLKYLKVEIQRLTLENKELKKNSKNRQIDELIEEIANSITELKEKLHSQNKRLKMEMGEKQKTISKLKAYVEGFVDRLEQLFINSDNFQKLLVNQISRLRKHL